MKSLIFKMKYKYNIFFFFNYILMASKIPFIRIENRYVLNYCFFSERELEKTDKENVKKMILMYSEGSVGWAVQII